MSNTISENDPLSSSSAVQISDEPNEMNPENGGQLETVSTSQNVSGTTLKRLYGSLPDLTLTALTTACITPMNPQNSQKKEERKKRRRKERKERKKEEKRRRKEENSASQNVSGTTITRPNESMPNLTVAALTTDGDTAAILQEPTAVTVQPVSLEPIVFDPTPIKLENNAGLQNHELSNINTSENETSSSSPAVPTTDEPTSMTPENGQLETISTSLNVSATTIKRLYGSLPNLTSTALTTAGNEIDTAAILQEPTAVNVQPVSVEPIAIGPTPIKLENNAGLRNQELPTAEVSSDQSATVSYRDGSGEPDLKSRDLAGLQKKLWHSMPNIALHYTDKTSYDTKIECTAPMKVSHDSSTRSSMTVTEPEVTQVKLKRCSLWKRAKKFARRVFCCAA
ncbi:unnamed protein product [Aphis gossypii]|uniref:Uncharacterized protein n=1 Tax=Aphis gossypii TaxID=80765 RepID=A0A9P0NEA1_APHGO|nr:unnamed protein product [Aphis gossypii]